MSLYYDAVTVLSSPTAGGSLKSRIYNSSLKLKASPPQIYALITETAKWDVVIAEVIEKAGILALEPKLTPLLATLLVHDHLFAKSGIAAAASHALRLAVERHKARLRAELTKIRISRRCATVPELKAQLVKEKAGTNRGDEADGEGRPPPQPRWVRVNEIVTDLKTQLETTFGGYVVVDSLYDLSVDKADKRKAIYLDPHVDNLVAIPGHIDMTTSTAYKSGQIILQDKASCFPAHILLGTERESWNGDIIDGCAAPGNKTTHLAALLSSQKKSKSKRSHIYACDASRFRSKTLQMMVSKAHAEKTVTVLQGQDFLRLRTDDERFANVTALLLDPSCSGSGIVNREDVPVLKLPAARGSGGSGASASASAAKGKGKKRKRNEEQSVGQQAQQATPPTTEEESEDPLSENPVSLSDATTDLSTRLHKLSSMQYTIVAHAMAFPSALRLSYSTCSIHDEENEGVIARLLGSSVARRRGWRLLTREEQVEGMKRWEWRGWSATTKEDSLKLGERDAESCVRSFAGNREGTGGFFVAVFVRDGSVDEMDVEEVVPGVAEEDGIPEENEDEEWGGFGDD